MLRVAGYELRVFQIILAPRNSQLAMLIKPLAKSSKKRKKKKWKMINAKW